MPTPREELEQLRKLKRLRELESKASGQVQAEPALEDVDPMRDIKMFGVSADDVVGGVNLGKNILTGAIAKPIAGSIAVKDVLQGEGMQGAETVKKFTEEIQSPLNESGQRVASKIGESISELSSNPAFSGIVEQLKKAQGEFTNMLSTGGRVLADPLDAVAVAVNPDREPSERTKVGEAIGASLGEAIPQTALEVAGYRGLSAPTVKAAVSATKKTLPKLPTPKQVTKLIKESAPSVEKLQGAARAIYNKIDELGVTIKPKVTDGLFQRINKTVKAEGFNAKIHPKVSGVLDELNKSIGQTLSVSEVDVLRKVARGAARSIDPDEARIGMIIMSKIDDTLDGLTSKSLIKGNTENVGKLYRQARDLWGRSRRSEMIEDAFEKAKNQASGFENGLRVQFRSILNNPKKLKGFKPDEIDAMKKVVRGGQAENTLKALGKFGFTEGQASTMLLGSAGVAGGAAIGGPVGAVAIPAIGQVSKNLAQKLTRNNSMLANDIIKAGPNARKIINSYFRAVPKGERSARDLTELLLGKELKGVSGKSKGLTVEENGLIRDAVFFNKVLDEQELKRALGLAVVTESERDKNE